MKLAVLSDVHGNHIALSRCIADAKERGIDTFIFLGDYLGELADPQKTMQLLYQLMSDHRCFFIRGNKEDYWLQYREGGTPHWSDKSSTTGSLLYTYNHLTDKDIAFFQSLPYTMEITLDGMPPITLCHGSPQKVNEKMLPDHEKTFALMEKSSTDLILCGHTHVQRAIEHQGKKVLNPGAVGVAMRSGGKAQCMILHGSGQACAEEFISLDYDNEQVIADLYASGLYTAAPYWCEVTQSVLRGGDVSHATVLAKAMDACTKATGTCQWPDIPECYWAEAVKELIEPNERE